MHVYLDKPDYMGTRVEPKTNMKTTGITALCVKEHEIPGGT
jgi:hypothetical protein